VRGRARRCARRGRRREQAGGRAQAAGGRAQAAGERRRGGQGATVERAGCGERRAYEKVARVGSRAMAGVATSCAAMPGATMLGKRWVRGTTSIKRADGTEHVTKKSAFHSGPLCANRLQEVKLVFRPTSKIWPFRSSYGKNTGHCFLSSFHQGRSLKKISKCSHERFKVQVTLWALVVRDCRTGGSVGRPPLSGGRMYPGIRDTMA
jgi:hypothetical protein